MSNPKAARHASVSYHHRLSSFLSHSILKPGVSNGFVQAQQGLGPNLTKGLFPTCQLNLLALPPFCQVGVQ